MSDLLWCPECRTCHPDEPSWLFVQRCEVCGTELEGEQPPLEVDFKELDTGYEEEQEEESEEGKDTEGDDAEAE